MPSNSYFSVFIPMDAGDAREAAGALRLLKEREEFKHRRGGPPADRSAPFEEIFPFAPPEAAGRPSAELARALFWTLAGRKDRPADPAADIPLDNVDFAPDGRRGVPGLHLVHQDEGETDPEVLAAVASACQRAFGAGPAGWIHETDGIPVGVFVAPGKPAEYSEPAEEWVARKIRNAQAAPPEPESCAFKLDIAFSARAGPDPKTNVAAHGIALIQDYAQFDERRIGPGHPQAETFEQAFPQAAQGEPEGALDPERKAFALALYNAIARNAESARDLAPGAMSWEETVPRYRPGKLLLTCACAGGRGSRRFAVALIQACQENLGAPAVSFDYKETTVDGRTTRGAVFQAPGREPEILRIRGGHIMRGEENAEDPAPPAAPAGAPGP